MALSTEELVRHILDEADFIGGELASVSRSEYLNDEVLKRAFVRSIEIIGEAVKKLPEQYRTRYPQIEWRLIAGMRDKLVHEYFGVDHDIVWDVATSKVPELATVLRSGSSQN